MDNKNTKICRHCKEEIPKNAKRCPKCGGKLGMPGWIKAIIIIVIILAGIVGCMSKFSNAVGDAVKEVKNEYKDVNGKSKFKVNEAFQNKFEKIVMTEVNTNFTDYSEFTKPSDGYKYIMAKFEIENINKDKDELSISSLEFKASADSVAVQSPLLVNDKYKDFSATIGKGKKTIGYIFYEVPVNAKKIIIEYNASFWTDGDAIEFIVQE